MIVMYMLAHSNGSTGVMNFTLFSDCNLVSGAREDLFDATLSALLELANDFRADLRKTPEEQVANITALAKVCIEYYTSNL